MKRIPNPRLAFAFFNATCLGLSLAAHHLAAQEATPAELSETDQLRIAVQQICPVTGQALGSMGDPVPVTIEGQVIYLCCASCQSGEVNTDHWQTIQSRLAKAQGVCPIMEQPVDATMESTVVDGTPVFVCCPPCIQKIEADAEGTMTKVHNRYRAFLASERQAELDRLHIAAQGICPVSGKKLDSMGDPVKVQVGEETAFLCCQGCLSQEIQAEHWKTVQANLAQAQQVCLVTGRPIDASMDSIVVSGRRVFACCPDCVAKIKAEPAAFAAKLADQPARSAR